MYDADMGSCCEMSRRPFTSVILKKKLAITVFMNKNCTAWTKIMPWQHS
jgi:hypothetical protein